MSGTLLQKFYRIVIMRLYTSDTILFLKYTTPTRNITEASIQNVTSGNVEDALSFQRKSQVRLFHKFLNRGDEGYYAYLHGRCVHRSWVVKGVQNISLHKFFNCQLRAHDIFIHYCETAPEARGKNIFAAVLSYIADRHQDKNVYTSVDARNRSSLRSMQKAGFVEIASVHVKVIFGVRRISIKADPSSEIYELTKG